MPAGKGGKLVKKLKQPFQKKGQQSPEDSGEYGNEYFTLLRIALIGGCLGALLVRFLIRL